MNRNALILKQFLDKHGPFVGTRYDLAHAVGLIPQQVDEGLRWCRDNATTIGWVIPLQQHGVNPATWRVIDNLNNLSPIEHETIAQSTEDSRGTTRGVLSRLVEQERLAASATTGRIRTEHLRVARVLDGAAAML